MPTMSFSVSSAATHRHCLRSMCASHMGARCSAVPMGYRMAVT
jgi:hypothetical protein